MEQKKVIFTDLDGTLLDEKYSFKKAKPALKILKEKQISLVICTSKTRPEIEFYRKKLGNKHPFISEDGGAIFIPKDYFSVKFKSRKIKSYYVIELGTRYEKLKKILKKIEDKTKAKIIAFSDMNIKDLVKDSGLNKEQAKLAMQREYDEPFKIYGKESEKQKILKQIKKQGLNYTKGGKYYHILGNNDKGKAIKILKRLYEENNKIQTIETIGLGDSRNDKEMLESVDRAFLLQKPNKTYANLNIKNNKITRVRGISSEGWNKAILNLFWHFNAKKAEELYKNSIKILKKLQLKNGAIFASPPKLRYPYIYPRDHAICILALIDTKESERAKKALEFILKSQNKNGSFPQRLDKKGNDKSYKPIQLDNTGLIIFAFARYIKQTSDNGFLRQNRNKIIKAKKYLKSQLSKKNLFFTPNSIHEFPPLEEGLEIWANATCYSALKELESIIKKNKTDIDLAKIKKSIEKYFWNKKHFIKNIRIKEASSVVSEIDASSYALADFGVFDDDNEKIKKTVKKIEKELWHKKLGGICRYKEHIGRNNGGWGPWPHFTLMICRHFIRLGQRKKAERYLEWVLKVSYKNRLPEHIALKKDFEKWVKKSKSAGTLRKDREIMVGNIRKSPMYKKGLAYSVLPLAWPHAEFIRTWNLYKKTFL